MCYTWSFVWSRVVTSETSFSTPAFTQWLIHGKLYKVKQRLTWLLPQIILCLWTSAPLLPSCRTDWSLCAPRLVSARLKRPKSTLKQKNNVNPVLYLLSFQELVWSDPVSSPDGKNLQQHWCRIEAAEDQMCHLLCLWSLLETGFPGERDLKPNT